MARHKKSYAGERFTVKRTLQLTPSQAAELDAVAKEQDARISDVARAILFRRSAARPNAGVRQGRRRVSKRELEGSQHANNAVGNLLNQLARHANTTGELGPQRLAELDEALALTRRATDLYIAAILHVMAR